MLIGKPGMTDSGSKNQRELLIAVIHSIQEPWLTITKEGQFKTWLNNNYANVSIAHFYAKPANPITRTLDGINERLRWKSGRRIGQLRNAFGFISLFFLRKWIPRISSLSDNPFEHPSTNYRVHCLDMFLTGRWKRLAVIDHFLSNHDADYLLLTTSSSYVQPERLLNRLLEIEDEVVYAGPLIGDENDNFVSGAQTVLNRKAAKLFVQNRGKIPVHLLDDVGLGRTAKKLHIKPIQLRTLNIDSIQKLREISIQELKDNHHFRLKAQVGEKRGDVEIFSELHKLLLK
jgi:hypothetical protein